MSKIKQEILDILKPFELTEQDAKEIGYQAEQMVEARMPTSRLVDRIRDYRGLVMGTLGFAGGIGGISLGIVLFPDQHLPLYNIFISPQQGMGALGVTAGTALGEILTRKWFN